MSDPVNRPATPPAPSAPAASGTSSLRAGMPRPLFTVAMVLVGGGALLTLRSFLAGNAGGIIFGIIDVVLGVGLFKLKDGWRKAALGWLAFLAGLTGLCLLVAFLTWGKRAPIFPTLHPGVRTVLLLVLCGLASAGCYVLTRPPVKAAFQE